MEDGRGRVREKTKERTRKGKGRIVEEGEWRITWKKSVRDGQKTKNRCEINNKRRDGKQEKGEEIEGLGREEHLNEAGTSEVAKAGEKT